MSVAIRTHLISIPPFHYLHVLDNNKNVTRLVIGPKTFRCDEHETVVFGPEKMIVVPPRHYCVIKNPVLRNEDGSVVVDEFGQSKLRHGDTQIRFEQPDPFPLYPGEVLEPDETLGPTVASYPI
jgi:major vault protein